jgi:predicted DNA-binding transcriptional regulator AlpA
MPRLKRPRPEPAPPIPKGAALLTPRQASEITGMSEAWFTKQRWKRKGPPFIRIGRAVRYVETELLQWLAERRVRPPRDE